MSKLNPKLVDRITNKHIAKGLMGRSYWYLPYAATRGMAEDLEVGSIVHIADPEIEGNKPDPGEMDTRMVQIAKGRRGDSRTGERKYLVFLRDLACLTGRDW